MSYRRCVGERIGLEPTISQAGLSVFRPVETNVGPEVSDMLVDVPGVRLRGLGSTYEEAVTVISRDETQQCPELHDVDSGEAQDMLYSHVRTLREPIRKIAIADAQIFEIRGSRAKMRSDALVLIPDIDTIEQLQQERQEAINALGMLAQRSVNFGNITPHITVCYFHDTDKSLEGRALGAVRDKLDTLTANIGRARFYRRRVNYHL